MHLLGLISFQHINLFNRERDLGVKGVLAMAGKLPGQLSDGTVAFCFGNCQMGSIGNVGSYATFQSYLIKKLREWKYFITFEDEYFTSQKFPMFVYQTTYSGDDKIRIKHCKELNIHINRGKFLILGFYANIY